MNIGIFTDTYYPEINGVANSTYQLKRELEERGNIVYVFTVSNPKMTDFEKHVFRMKSIPLALLKERRVGCSILSSWYKVIMEKMVILLQQIVSSYLIIISFLKIMSGQR